MQAEFVNTASFTAEMGQSSQGFETGLQQSVRIPENDHTKLLNRDSPDQHPMSAISGLENSLGAKLNSSSALTNLEIEAILGGI